uniref:Uncharacterized protein n=1 Tax=Gopherus agassizii TaxID=38772 RepID=A0A452GG66_9SAUR
MNESRKSDEKNIDNRKDDREELLEFSENFNQLELLETHRHLIPIGTQSLWSGESDEEDEEEEKSEEWYQLQEKKMENNPEKLLLWAAEKNQLPANQMFAGSLKQATGRKVSWGEGRCGQLSSSLQPGTPVEHPRPQLSPGPSQEPLAPAPWLPPAWLLVQLSTVRRLLSQKLAPVNIQDEDQYTPLHRAAYGGHLDVVRELIAQGADVHALTVDGWTPLHSACKWNNTKVASFLLQHGADINAQTNGLLTPLHLAAGNRGSKETLELLLMNRYVKPNLKNNLDETAFDIARRTDIYHYLFEIVENCTNSVPDS